jgi:DNA-binding response OmpR family regulator
MTRDMDIAKGSTLGADAYITKPFSREDILRAVRSVA